MNVNSLALRALALIPLAVAESLTSKVQYLAWVKLGLTRKNVIALLITSVFKPKWSFGLIYGSENLIRSHSYVRNTLVCIIFTVLICYYLCLKPYRPELLGLAVTIGGVVLFIVPADEERT